MIQEGTSSGLSILHPWNPELCALAAAVVSGLLRLPVLSQVLIEAGSEETLRGVGRLVGPQGRVDTELVEGVVYDSILLCMGDCRDIDLVRPKILKVLRGFGEKGWLMVELRHEINYKNLVNSLGLTEEGQRSGLKVREQTDLTKFRRGRRLILFRFSDKNNLQEEVQCEELPLTDALIREAAVNVLAAFQSGSIAGRRAVEVATLAQSILAYDSLSAPSIARPPPGFEHI